MSGNPTIRPSGIVGEKRWVSAAQQATVIFVGKREGRRTEVDGTSSVHFGTEAPCGTSAIHLQADLAQ